MQNQRDGDSKGLRLEAPQHTPFPTASGRSIQPQALTVCAPVKFWGVGMGPSQRQGGKQLWDGNMERERSLFAGLEHGKTKG